MTLVAAMGMQVGKGLVSDFLAHVGLYRVKARLAWAGIKLVADAAGLSYH